MEIIKSDCENDMAFTLIEFLYHNEKYIMGSCVIPPEAEERKENIFFVFQGVEYAFFDAFEAQAYIGNTKVSELDEPIEVIRAGIIGNEALLATPWGETRLAKKALNR